MIKVIVIETDPIAPHYAAYDANNKKLKCDGPNIHHIKISKYCNKIYEELMKRYYDSGKTSFTIHMKHSHDDLTIATTINNEFVITGGYYTTPIVLSNLGAVANAIIHYDEDKFIHTLLQQQELENTYDDNIFDEYLITLC